jgi:hypothetical protein
LWKKGGLVELYWINAGPTVSELQLVEICWAIKAQALDVWTPLFPVDPPEHVYGGKTRVFSAIYHFFLSKSNVREVGYKFGGHLFLTLMLNTRI